MLERVEHRRAISWFKPDAEVDLHGYHVEVLRTTEPGTVVFEDGWQVIAKPGKGQ